MARVPRSGVAPWLRLLVRRGLSAGAALLSNLWMGSVMNTALPKAIQLLGGS